MARNAGELEEALRRLTPFGEGERGIEVPAQLSLVGFDDTAIASHIRPPLTTVRWPIRTMARAAALKLIDPERAVDQAASFPSDLVRRSSAVAPPARR